MLKNYLLLTVRSLTKNKAFIIINVLGMGVAIACCIVSYFAWRYDQTFDRAHENRESIYRVSAERTFQSTTTRFGRVPLALGSALASTFSGIDQSARHVSITTNLKRNDDLFAVDMAYVDPAFFRMFSFEFIAGDNKALDDATRIAIPESMAIRLFGSAYDAVGKDVSQVMAAGLKEVKIGGVFREPPMNSSFHKRNGSAYISFVNYRTDLQKSEDDWFTDASVYIQIKDQNSLPLVKKQLTAYAQRNNQTRENFQVKDFGLDLFASMAHRDRDENVQAGTWAAPPTSAITGSMIMSFLILLIACFNLANTSIAISTRRLKEIGMRKVMGSQRLQIGLQFIGEATFVCLVALVVALALTDLFVEGWNLMTGNMIHLEPDYFAQPAFIVFLVVMLLITGVLAGSYPAFYLSRFQPVTILKGKLRLGGTNLFTRMLLGLQFTISLITVVSAIGFLQNARYQEAYDLGFDVRGTIVTWINGKSEFDTYRNALHQHSDVLSVAGSHGGIFSERRHEAVAHDARQAEVDIIEVGDGYLPTMGLALTAGRDFVKNSETDLRESVIITENMAELFDLKEPLGAELVWQDTIRLHVIGVIRDVYTHGLWREMEPMMIRYVSPDAYTQLIVRTSQRTLSSVNDFMEAQWRQIFPTRLYNGYMMSQRLQDTTSLSMSITSGYTFVGAIALLLSVTGLYALVSLNMTRRLKEIGIRKIVGASIAGIAQKVNREFIVILGVASLLGSYAGNMWCNVLMSSIWKYYQPVGWWTFTSAVIVMLAASLGAIAYRVITIARTNPVNTLRDE